MSKVVARTCTLNDVDLHSREELRALASRYYLQEETMESIGASLGVSRSTVSRLLAQARREGIVRISVAAQAGETPTAAAIEDHFGVRVHVVPVRDSATSVHRLDQVARVAAELLTEWFTDRMTLGLAWGTTLSAVVEHLPRHPTRGSCVVQLNGAANVYSTGVTYAGQLLETAAAALDATVVYFPTPAFFDYAATREALWRERSVRRVIEVQRTADLVVFSVGAVRGEVASQVYSGRYLGPQDLAELARDRVVGDVCTVFLREDGSWADIALNARASGPTPHDLLGVPRRVCVVSGTAKVAGLLGALRSGVVTELVLDAATAAALLDRVGVRPERTGGHTR